jgi:hypothetical protein
MIVGDFQVTRASEADQYRIFDMESDRYVQNAEFNTAQQAYEFAIRLEMPGSTERAKHLDHMIDLFSGIA